MDRNRFHSFALNWLRKYEDDRTPRRMLEESFPSDCFDLGFDMDCGESFEARFSSEAFRDPRALAEVIADIHDPVFLGTAIFSKWRGITHWWEQELFEPRNRAWFIMAFQRLAEITREAASTDNSTRPLP